jgi:hypothetical protein
MLKFALWILAIPAVIVAGLFGFAMYKQVTDNRSPSARIHDQCVKENGPHDEVAINSCKFRLVQRHLDEVIDRIERHNAR